MYHASYVLQLIKKNLQQKLQTTLNSKGSNSRMASRFSRSVKLDSLRRRLSSWDGQGGWEKGGLSNEENSGCLGIYRGLLPFSPTIMDVENGSIQY